jgi:hypothetical protein
MLVILEALEDANLVNLCFATDEDADRFVKFNVLHQISQGGGNRFGQYWMSHNKMTYVPADQVTAKHQTVLHRRFLNPMIDTILYAAKAKGMGTSPYYRLTLGGGEEGIRFAFDLLSCEAAPTQD